MKELDNKKVSQLRLIQLLQLKLLLEDLRNINDSDDHERLRDLLIEIVPGFKPQSKISDILYTNKNKFQLQWFSDK